MSDPTLTIELLERMLAELEQSTEIAVDVKLQAVENYQAAIRNLQAADSSSVRLQALVAETESVPQRCEQLKLQLSELKDKKPTIENNPTLQELEQILPTTELSLSTLKKARQDAESELQARAPRRKEIRERMAVIQEKIVDAQTQLRALSSVTATPQSKSLTARLATRQDCLLKEKLALEAELTKFDAEEAADLVRQRIEFATCNAAYTEKLIGLLQQDINEKRETAARNAVRIARREAIETDPALRSYAEENQKLAEDAKTTGETIALLEQELKTTVAAYESLIRQVSQTKKKVDTVGLTTSVGALLRKQLGILPDAVTRSSSVAKRQRLINETQYALFEYEEQRHDLIDLDGTISTIVEAVSQNSTQDSSSLESSARDLATRKQEYLNDLVRSTGKCFDTLIELDMVDRQLFDLEGEYGEYIDQRILWIRSGRPLSAGLQVGDSDVWLLRPLLWFESGQLLVSDAKSNAILYVVVLGMFVLLGLRSYTMKNRITELGEVAQKANCRSIVPTFRALFLTFISSFTLPIFSLLLGWRLTECAGDSEFTWAIGNGFKTVSLLWAVLNWVRYACQKNGLGDAHFGWPSSCLGCLRRELKILKYVALPIAFVAATLASSDGFYERSDVQRVAFILGMCAICIVAIRLFRTKGMFRVYFASNPNSVFAKFKCLYPFAAVSVPFCLAMLAVTGYFYTAQTLFWRFFITCVFFILIVVVRSILDRMLLLRRRHLQMERTRQRALAAKGADYDSAATRPLAGIITDNKEADISEHISQSYRLVGTGMMAIALVGLWMIWIQALPALGMIGNYTVWGKPKMAPVVAEVTAPAPTPITSPVTAAVTTPTVSEASIDDDTPSDSVTVADLALAILIVFITFVLFRNGPGLLEMLILEQLPFEASVRYAITTLISYFIVMIGTIAACSTIGLQWSQIQWLATALTFGLAFGLQELFANFVAGLIILLERPIRVGDVVTVDDVTGVVSRIRIRATSITNWDRKEYVVPNKEFITGRLLNWTLSDKVNRVVVEVGLAYGSDTERARELLIKAANDHPAVLQDPPAIATFQGFGDNSLNLVLRAFLPTLENRLQVIHELHTVIDQSFRKAGIEIAFPQRDLHIRTIHKEAAKSLLISPEIEYERHRDAA